MPRLRSLIVIATAALGATAPAAHGQATPPTDPVEQPSAAPAPTAPAPGYPADTPKAGALYRSGPSGRYLLGGTWLFRFDTNDKGVSQGLQRRSSTAGWSRVSVPNAWNATDQSRESFAGTAGFYRKDFKLPSRARRFDWVVRFESVNYRSKVWLNGRPLGTNRGAYLPFELRLPARLLKRGATNRLVIRVDNRRRPTDFPPSNLNPKGQPTGGWWNYGGLLREVYLRKVDTIDFTTVQVQPSLPCTSCTANVKFRVTARNYSTRSQRVRMTASFGGRRLTLGTASIGPRRFATFVRSLRVAKPRLWSVNQPNLYDVRLRARSGGGSASYFLVRTGIRSIRMVDGHIVLNGKLLNVRGVGYHEDDPKLGFAIDNRVRDEHLRWVKEVGAGMLRSHYPLHPYTQERADALGLLLWSEIPVYGIRTKYLKQRLVRDLAAKELRDNILVNGNHPSILVWSIGNELSSRPGPVQGFYINTAVRTAHELDPTRPVGLAVAGYPAAGCQPEYKPLDVIGVNDYFGWYPGPNGQIADRTLLSDYLESVHQCYPKQAVFVTEFGAEANRDGPVEEKGTFGFQSDLINYNLGVFATKPWLNGALYWAIQEFRVRPDWDGGNPHPTPPIHQKGLVTFDGKPKPAFFDVQKSFRATPQLRSSRIARYSRPPHGR